MPDLFTIIGSLLASAPAWWSKLQGTILDKGKEVLVPVCSFVRYP
jgi:hypothetical protein